MRPPSSIPTRSRSASWGLGAIQRTCDVQGRGGKLHVGRDGSSSKAVSSRQPRRAAVGRLADAGLAQADVDDVGILGIGGKTLRPRSLEKELDAAPVAVLVESRDSVARRRPE